MTAARPYSPETLAARWGCSAEKVRLMYHAGELAGFRLGKLIRIPAAEVDRYECQNTPSHGTEISSQSHGESRDENTREESRLARLTNDEPKQSAGRFGNASTQRKATG
ncbi:excisionase family DNA-binding protein [Altererythrobacter sp. HHU K3-1]|uniref:Excisionase family DNA-binding protein n=1 Tax=Qipengyuania atrilutea TaxID=2744473 RepID=A0A850HEP7_9SPHN|nr:excisionase family DNA-binding protein [Actirhodobacter atriluteus]